MSLVLDAVSKVVGRSTHIADVSLALEAGSLNVLLGPTLSGKTTLMRIMAGLEPPTSGRVLFEGHDVTGVPVRRRNVAMVYQQFINYPALSVYENIASPLRVAGRPKSEIDSRVMEAARLLRLEPMLERTPLELSGGQQQRTALARALVKNASLVLLDEPLANLDYKLREELREELPKIFAAAGAILVYATTEPSEALLLGGNTATLHEGRVTQFGRTLDVYRQPVDQRTAAVFSDPPMNFLKADIRGGVACTPEGIVLPLPPTHAALPDGAAVLGFRPDHLHLQRRDAGSVALAATVAVVEITGSESFVHVTHGGARWIALAHGVHDLRPGTPIEVHLDPRRIFLFDAAGQLLSAPERAEAA
ncbi:ABC transporter ATP-binding protein [Terrihabitans rhizophilus]|uniref:ABC transporter ATP-binding protein n=1 Tax=Terrihabitans rhizophilus TaxID=3092662 RepID=A0ABU4RLP6_9HYPH|nr:ABC transporter ATP-binding protein [Terrihabitans sp. PJ23]MDX6805727.1 ABC transporter ATP-binding protein [Terrihabitans sp. PJ23]